ncbi:DUF2058 family protein [Myxococcus sp. K15C18031901]|uniref:DUF2058 family protein n=1 Tax=Myxococcus dinghuensis TaxID=2906761 RepID=UPI0020A7ABC4|nr:DUF2058 family protein [Myxococcus dinghuensis]MCP3101972.1 DUF2058 family protein [Myxococcus dinghuensis]
MQNLRDKLLKAGLVTEEQTKKADTAASQAEARRPSSQEGGRPGGSRPPPRRDENRTAGGPPRSEDRGPREGGRPGGGGGGGRPGGGAPRHHGAPRHGGGPTHHGRPAPAVADRPIPKLPPMPGSKAYQRAESKRQIELDRALRELALGSQVAQEPGETAFYFMTRKGKLRRLELSPEQAKRLEEGELAVVERPDPAQIEHSLVPAAAAEQMFALSKKAVRFLNRKDSPIGFMNDEELKAQQAAEAAGTAPELPDEPEADAAEAPTAPEADAAPEPTPDNG